MPFPVCVCQVFLEFMFRCDMEVIGVNQIKRKECSSFVSNICELFKAADELFSSVYAFLLSMLLLNCRWYGQLWGVQSALCITSEQGAMEILALHKRLSPFQLSMHPLQRNIAVEDLFRRALSIQRAVDRLCSECYPNRFLFMPLQLD